MPHIGIQWQAQETLHAHRIAGSAAVHQGHIFGEPLRRFDEAQKDLWEKFARQNIPYKLP